MTGIELSQADRARINELFEQGLYVQAHQLGQSIGPLRQWSGPDGQLLAGRVAMHCGAGRLAAAIHIRAWRKFRTHPGLTYYYVRGLMETLGLLAAWEFMRDKPALAGADNEMASQWLSLRAHVAGQFRDFDAADTLIQEALKLGGDDPWVRVEQAWLLEQEDRYEEALAAARESMKLRPWYRPAVQASGHILQLLGREDEAMALMAEGGSRLESFAVWAQLAALQIELKLYDAATVSLDRMEALSPMMDRALAAWLNAQRSEIAYFRGDYPTAAMLARAVPKSKFFAAIAERLSSPPLGAKRVLLDVDFVRQHHSTCAPATLTALSRFWSMPAEHLEVAEKICYDGTPYHSIRSWAEQNGFAAREFAITEESTRALLDRGVPFAIATVEPLNAHLQALVGYDGLRGTLLIRDPYIRSLGESMTREMLDHWRSTGPWGMAIVPRDASHRLDGLDLKDSALYDLHYELQKGLLQHDRPAAAAIRQRMRETAPEHRLTYQADLAMASYDSDQAANLAAINKLLELFPGDRIWQHAKLLSLGDLSARAQRLELLAAMCEGGNGKRDPSHPGTPTQFHPAFYLRYAQELSEDARSHAQAVRLLRKALGMMPSMAGAYYVLADIYWQHRRFDEACELYRFATCLEDKNESFARSYFVTSRHFKKVPQAIEFLTRRFKRFGAKSSQPARTLLWAYLQLDQTTQAQQVLEEALKLRPDDGPLMLFAAETFAQLAKAPRAAELLEQARDKTPRTDWLRTAAMLADMEGELAKSLGLWQQVAQAEPMAIDALRAVARLLAETQGPPAALEFLRKRAAQFPYNFPIHQLWIEWLRDEDPARSVEIIEHLIAVDPVNAWTRREMALTLARMGRHEEAMTHAEAALNAEPSNPYSFCVRGKVFITAGKTDQARQDYRRAIALSVDTAVAISELVGLSRTADERKEALDYVHKELVRQVIFGDGLLAWRDMARRVMDRDELLKSLRAAHEARPDLWHAWAAVIRQLTDNNRLDEALKVARQAVERFPLLPVLWLDLARVCRLKQDAGGEIAALEHATQINPEYSPAVRQLADAYERGGKLDKAREILVRGVARMPLDAPAHGCLAAVLWKLDHREEAIAEMQQAIRRDAESDWAWDTLVSWGDKTDQPELATRLARELISRKPGLTASWMALARHARNVSIDERLKAIDKAISLSPHSVDAYEFRASLLSSAGRYDEAVASCRPAGFGDHVPVTLRGREACIEADRGNLPGAIEKMKAVLQEDPTYTWGLSRLADWYELTKAYQDYLQTAIQLLRNEPNDAVALGYVGHARLLCDDKAGAKIALSRALSLDPAYTFAGVNLFNIQMEANETADAAATLSRIEQHLPPDQHQAYRVRLAIANRDTTAGTTAFRKLCLTRTETPTWLRRASDALLESGGAWLVKQVLDETVLLPESGRYVPALWIERSMGPAAPLAQIAGVVDRLAPDAEKGPEAVAAFIGELGERRMAGPLRKYLKRYREICRADEHAWNTTVRALVNADLNREALDWYGNWKTRQNPQPWVMLSVCLAMRYTGREAEGAQVNQMAIGLPEDLSTPLHHVWLALDAALAARHQTATEHLRKAQFDSLTMYYKFLYLLSEAAVVMARTTPAKTAADFSIAKAKILSAARTYQAYRKDKCALRAFRQTVKLVAKARGGFGAAVWAFLQQF
ncbi:MAG: tetratricopeptide repeat protein [Phycisphaerae bacterium]